jgi:hypothetical protein
MMMLMTKQMLILSWLAATVMICQILMSLNSIKTIGEVTSYACSKELFETVCER